MNSRIKQDVEKINGLKERMTKGELSRRGFLTAAMGFSSAALLTACSGGMGDSDGGKSGGSASKVVPLYTSETDPATLAFYNMAIANFNKKYPDIEVKVTSYSDENQLQYLSTAFQNKVDLGIFSPAVSSFAEFAQAGQLMELDELITDIGEDDFLPGTRVTIAGHDYGMPIQNNASMVYYRKDLLEKAGLSMPKTFEDYIAAIEALNGEDGRSGIAMAVGPTAQLPLQFFAPYIYQSGHDYFDREGNVTFDKPEVLDAVNRFVSVMKFAPKSMYNGAFGDIVSAYVAGQTGFATFPGRLGVTLADRAPDIAENTGVMPIPAGPFMTGELHFGSGQQYGVYAKTGNPEMAKEFLKHLTTGDEALAFSMTVPGHLLPTLKSVRSKFEELVANPTDEYLTAHGDWVKTFLDATPGAMTASVAMGAVVDKTFEKRITNVCPWAADIWPSPAIDGAMFQEILLDGRNSEEAWLDASGKMKKVTEEWKSANPDWKPEVV